MNVVDVHNRIKDHLLVYAQGLKTAQTNEEKNPMPTKVKGTGLFTLADDFFCHGRYPGIGRCIVGKMRVTGAYLL